jgi:phenylacetate-CoA ligase
MNKLLKLMDHTVTSFHLLQLKRDQWIDFRQLKNIKFKKLKAIIKHAYDYVPYYHRLFRFSGVKPEDIKRHEDLKKIPPVSKQDICENHQDFITRGLEESKMPSSFTSGSTGIPLKICYDHFTLNFHYALGRYIFSECGVKPNDRFVTIWGRAQSIAWSKPYTKIFERFNEILVPAFFEEDKLVNVLRKINPDVICTFPSILTLLANMDVSGITPRLIFTQGETVTQHCRDSVKKAFNLEIFDTYGSVEFEFLAFECEEHWGLHMITDGTYIEFIDENGDYVSPGEEGEIIVTGLYNRAMPLIRYRIGDVGIPTDEKCPCGRSLPLIKSIQGRSNDYLVLHSGRKISYMNFYDAFYKEMEKNVFCISQFQIVQESMDKIFFKVVKGRNFDLETLNKIKKAIETFFAKHGENMEVIIQVVDDIPKGKTGKRALISKIVK